MKKMTGLLMTCLAIITLAGCSEIAKEVMDSEQEGNVETAMKQDTGEGAIKLINDTITIKDKQLEMTTTDINEEKKTFVSVANKIVLEEKIQNGKTYTLNIENIEDAHRTDYKPKVQLLQTDDDTIKGNITTFKQVRYTVKKN